MIDMIDMINVSSLILVLLLCINPPPLSLSTMFVGPELERKLMVLKGMGLIPAIDKISYTLCTTVYIPYRLSLL